MSARSYVVKVNERSRIELERNEQDWMLRDGERGGHK